MSAEGLVLSPKANSKLGALTFSGKFQPRNTDEASACTRPGGPTLDGQVTLDPVPHFLSTLKGSSGASPGTNVLLDAHQLCAAPWAKHVVGLTSVSLRESPE